MDASGKSLHPSRIWRWATSCRRCLGDRLHRAIASLPAPLLRLAGTFGHWFMASRQLRGIKRRAERKPARR